MNKKEEIKYLKEQLKYYKSIAYIAKEALEPVNKIASQRGARMQLMMEFILKTNSYHSIIIPKEFNDWFDIDGVPR